MNGVGGNMIVYHRRQLVQEMGFDSLANRPADSWLTFWLSRSIVYK
jgi:hypothetical protein